MAKVTGPLLSLAASGTVSGLVSFRMGRKGAEVTKKPHPRTPPTTQQTIERQRMRDARTAFKALSNADLANWQAWATFKGRPVWMAFFAEWQAQQIEAGQAPLIPDPNIY